jgi:hypothetical protein
MQATEMLQMFKSAKQDEYPPTSLPTCDSDAYLIRGFSASANQRRDIWQPEFAVPRSFGLLLLVVAHSSTRSRQHAQLMQ